MSHLIYNIGIAAYSAAIAIASFFNKKAALMRCGHRNVWKKLEAELNPQEQYIWIHAASLGEFEQGRPLIDRLRNQKQRKKILLTFFSPSGYEIRNNWQGADIITYLPFDTPGNVHRFLTMTQPIMAIFIKYEFWSNYLHELKRMNIPAYLISAVFRPNQLFFRRSGKCYKKLLYLFSHIFVQDIESQKLLSSIGVKDTTIAGDTRFDRVTDILLTARPIKQLEIMKECGFPIFMIGSSWETDEDIYIGWLNHHKGRVKAVIAPHEFDTIRLKRLCQRLEGKTIFLSEINENTEIIKNADILIIDCFGLLSSAYKYADFVWVGGGFGKGIHNINEPAVFGIPVLFGPNNAKFIEAQEMKACGGGFEINDSIDAGLMLDKLLSDNNFRNEAGNAAGNYIQSHIGATDIIYSYLFPTS